MRVLTIRVLAGVALVVAPMLGAIGRSTQAGAASTTTCSAVVGKLAGKHARLHGCTLATTGGSGVLGLDSSDNGDLVKWSNGGTTTFEFKPVRIRGSAAKSSCPSGQVEDHLLAKVIGSTGAAAAVKGRVSAYLCLPSSGNGNVTLVPGTVWKF
jgi:hypothetical protein